MRSGIYKTCKCGKEFYLKPSLLRIKSCSISCGQKGRKFTKEQKLKIAQSAIGNKYSLGRIPWNKGLKGFLAGKEHYNWVEDRTKLKDDHKDRGGQLHREWSKQVKNRDGWKCKISNNDCSGHMVAHHIISWSSHPELRYEINNGITLCLFHHPLKRCDEKRLAPTFQELVGQMK